MFDISLMDVFGNLIIGSLASKVLTKAVGEKKAAAIVTVGAVASYVVPKAIDHIKGREKHEKTKEKTMTVTDMTWERAVKVDKYKTETKSGWELEDGAYDVQVEKKVRSSSKSAEFSSSFGSVSIPITKEDLYYIYKVDKWTYETMKLVTGHGEYDHEKFMSAFNSIKTTFDANDTIDFRKPADGDTRKLTKDTVYTITLVDDETGDIYTYKGVIETVYNAFKIGDKASVTLGGIGKHKYVKHIRKVVDPIAEVMEAVNEASGETSDPEKK